MARTSMILIGTDGVVDYVQLPDGQKYMLGPVSVLKLITGLVGLGKTAKAALAEFTENNQTMLKVDIDRMWDLLPYRRARFSSEATSSLMPSNDRKPKSNRGRDMLRSASFDTFTKNASMAEGIIQKVASTADEVERLVGLGKKFDASRAKSDLHKIASRVAEIAQSVDLGYPWVTEDLTVLAKQATDIAALFKVSV